MIVKRPDMIKAILCIADQPVKPTRLVERPERLSAPIAFMHADEDVGDTIALPLV